MFATAPLIVRGNMGLPDGARRTMQQDQYGNQVFEEDEPIYETKQRLDAAGEPVYRLSRTNERVGKVMERVQTGTEVRTFTLVDLGNGIVTKNYDWEPAPGELLRAEARETHDPAAVMRRLDRLEAALAAAGLTAADAEELAVANDQRQTAEAARLAREQVLTERRIARASMTPEQRAAAKAERQKRRVARRTHAGPGLAR